jgi:hypothetical protein
MARLRGSGTVARAVGAAVLSLGLFAGPLLGTSQAATLDSFSGKGSGYALGVSVDLTGLPTALKTPIQSAYSTIRNALPADVKAVLPAQFSFVVDQRLIETLAEMGVTQNAESLLGSGSIDLAALLGGAASAKATTTGASHTVTKALKLPTDDVPLVNVTAGALDAAVASGPSVDSAGTLTQVNASLEALMSMLPTALADQLQAALDQVTTEISDAVDAANTTLASQVSSVASNLTNTVQNDPVLGGILDQAGLGDAVDQGTSAVTTQLTNLLKLPDLSNLDLLGQPLAAVNNLKNTATSKKTSDGVVMSDATTQLASINVLGLLHTNAVSLSSHSEAAGTDGSAKNTSSCKILDVRLGNANGVSLDGENLYVNGVAVPTPAGNLQTITSAINGITSAAGLTVQLCDATQKDAAADGTSAAQRVSALRIELAPKMPVAVPALGIAAGQSIFKIVIDPTVETSVAARIATPSQSTATPHTGPNAVATIAVGIGLAGTAIFLRKKFA